MSIRPSLYETKLAVASLAHDVADYRQAGVTSPREVHLDEAHEALLRAERHLGHADRLGRGATS